MRISMAMLVMVVALGLARAQEPKVTKDTLLLATFDTLARVTHAAGDAAVVAKGAKLVDGKHGKGLALGPDEYITLAPEKNLDPKQGTLMFWFRPNWSSASPPVSHALLSWGWADGKRAEPELGPGYFVLSDGWWETGGGAGRLYLVFENQLYAHTSLKRVFIKEQWQQIAFTWKFTDHPAVTLYINGEQFGTTHGRKQEFIPKLRSPIHLGTDLAAGGGGKRSADGVFDSLQIWSRSFTAREVRDTFRAQEPEWRKVEARKFQWLRDGLAKPYAPRRDRDGVVLESRALLDEGNGWVSEEGAREVVDKLKRAGFNAYIPCVWHGRGTTWPSELTSPDAKTEELLKAEPGVDPLERLIDLAHAEGIQVHPWFCVAYRDPRWPHLEQFAEEGTPKGAFEMQNPAFRAFVSDLMLEVVRKYDVDGINLDYIRTKGMSKSPTAKRLFKHRFGVELADALAEKQENGWINANVLQWQADAVAEVVRTVAEKGRAIKPRLVVSVDGHPAAPGSMPSAQGRNGADWVKRGWVDVLYRMDYSRHLSWEKENKVRQWLAKPEAVVTIVGNYERTPEKRVVPREAKLVADLMGFCQRRDLGNGVSLYLLSMLDEAQIEALRTGPFREPARPHWGKW